MKITLSDEEIATLISAIEDVKDELYLDFNYPENTPQAHAYYTRLEAIKRKLEVPK